MKPKLKPLTQWFCDECGEVIEEPKQGWLEWRVDDATPGQQRVHGVRIVHHFTASPLASKSEDGCYYAERDSTGACDLTIHNMHLDAYAGHANMITLLEALAGDPRSKAHELDGRELAEVMRRLYVPHYEEARRYLPSVEREHDIDRLPSIERVLEVIELHDDE